MKTATLIRNIRKKLTGATQTVVAELRELRHRIKDLRRELHLAHGPVPREELTARIQQAVSESAEAWLARTPNVIQGRRRLGDPELQGRIALPWSFADAVPWGFICKTDPGQAIKMLTALTNATEYEPGPPLAERESVIAELEAQLVEIETAEEQRKTARGGQRSRSLP